MDKKELAQFKKLLIAKKNEILSTLQKDGLKLTHPESSRHGDLADRSSVAIDTEINIQLKQTDAKLLKAIEKALERIEKGNYGICTECADEPLGLCETCPEISPVRLRAVPWTKVCVAVKDRQQSS
jgi:DnaK suppressor protein